jgi:hypothetical protein
VIYMGIDRGDGRTDEQKAAAENIEIAFSALPGDATYFRCRECSGPNEWQQNIEHKPGCKTGEILEGKCAK